MKILIVSGFLGAGKTTFITHMARTCSKKFVVMENEMGAVGVDGGILKSASSDMKVWELTEGCICCSMKTDFATSVLTIESALQPDYLLVEPTGVGMLSRIIANIKSIEYERISTLAPITIVDALACAQTQRDFPDIFADQLGAAGTVVLSKTEGMSADERDAAREYVSRWAPGAEIVSQPYAERPAVWWDGLWRRDPDSCQLTPRGWAERTEETSDGDVELDSAGFSYARVPSPGAMAACLERAVRGEYGRIVRAKGFVPYDLSEGAHEMMRFDVVEGSYSITDADCAETPKAVFIGRELDVDALRRELSAELAEDEHEHHHHHEHEHEHHDHEHRG